MNGILDFLTNDQTITAITVVFINLLLAGIMAFFVRFVFINYAQTMSNRRSFSNIFFLMTVCTALIITVIQSSIALSLGLVGALSIVRFRTAIKEPEELVYLFLCIAIGLGLGANERFITIAAGILVLLILMIRGIINKKNKNISEPYNLDIDSRKIGIDEITTMLIPFCESLVLKRYSTDESHTNICLSVELANIQKLELAVMKLKEADSNVKVGFIPNSAIS